MSHVSKYRQFGKLHIWLTHEKALLQAQRSRVAAEAFDNCK